MRLDWLHYVLAAWIIIQTTWFYHYYNKEIDSRARACAMALNYAEGRIDPDRPFSIYGNDQIVIYLPPEVIALSEELGRGISWEEYKHLLSPELVKKVEEAWANGEEVQIRTQ